MRHVAVLAEDRSSVPLLERVLLDTLRKEGRDITYSIHPHRGKGRLPKDFKERPNPKSGAVLAQLPAKLRAYQKTYRRCELLVVVVFDADDDEVKNLYGQTVACFNAEAPELVYCIALAVEEFEAWLLGDFQAILKAFPKADRNAYQRYQQDSITGTWEHLAKVLEPQRAKGLIEADYPQVGMAKMQWAKAITPHMNFAMNRSPSFQTFLKHLNRALAFWREA